MDYHIGSSPQDAAVHQFVGGRFIGVSANPLLSIKCMFGGIGDYTTDNGQRHRVDDSNYLVLNHGHDYTIEKRAKAPVESFCIFFPTDFSASLANQFARSDDQLLDAGPTRPATQFNFFEHLRPQNDVVTKHIQALRAKIVSSELDSVSVELHLMGMFTHLMSEHADVRKRLAKLSWSRCGTRTELYRRIHVARDYIHANMGEPFSLDLIASTAALSKYHFLRAFREILGETPLSYLQRIRVEKAKGLLSTTNLSVTEIANAVGYVSLPSFSSLFRAHTRLSPSAFRKRYPK